MQKKLQQPKCQYKKLNCDLVVSSKFDCIACFQMCPSSNTIHTIFGITARILMLHYCTYSWYFKSKCIDFLRQL